MMLTTLFADVQPMLALGGWLYYTIVAILIIVLIGVFLSMKKRG